MSSFINYNNVMHKVRVNVLENIYRKPPVMKAPVTDNNVRLRFRFREAIKEAQDICAMDKNSQECHMAWYEVDELEDSLMRLEY